MKYSDYSDELLMKALRNLREEISYYENKRDFPNMMKAIKEFNLAHNEHKKR